MRIRQLFFILITMVFLGGCIHKEYNKQESALIVFRTSVLKYADLGFIYEGSSGLKIELYNAGQAVMSLEITASSVCMSLLECMDKKHFNATVLSPYYPRDILDHIFKGEMIFDGIDKQSISNGFTQNISKDNKYKINYRVLTNQIIFRDTINAILIKIKRI